MTEIDTNPKVDDPELWAKVGQAMDRKVLWEAAELVVSTQFGSPSMLQRKLRIGWELTGRMMDALEALGVVGPDQGSQTRDVKIKLVEDLEPVFETLYGDGGAAFTALLDTNREAPTAIPAQTAELQADEPDEYEDADADDEPAPEHSRPIEGTVYTPKEWELREDPEGDRPWINPQLRTKEGRKARYAYLRRQARRRARKAAARQLTVHGIVPRALRGERRMRAWVIGMEGYKAAADERLALAAVKTADQSARRAQIALLKRGEKQVSAVKLQMEAGKQLAVAQNARKTAKRAVAFRAGYTYGPVIVADAAAFGFADVWGFLGALVLNLVGVSLLGRDVEVSEAELDRLERIEAGHPQEFSIGMTPSMFENMAREALTGKLGCELTSLRVEPHTWGFEIHVVLNGMTPEKIADGLNLLEACLPGVRTSSLQLRQSKVSRNRCLIVVPGPNPWKDVPELPYREPKSLKTADIATQMVAASMSADPLGLPMCRTNVNLVGKSRSGKSTWLRAILDVLTATVDQIVIGIDLGSAGSGFGGLREGMHLVVTDPHLAAEVLDYLLAVGQGRPALFDELGMGQNWQTSRARPGYKLIVEEFPAFVKASRKPIFDGDGKKIGELDLDGKLQEMSVTCAKSDVTLVVAGQGLTRALIGKNTWLTELPVQVMCACDKDDVGLLLPAGAMAEGWRPTRLLPAMGDAVNDASVAYVLAGAEHSEPITYRACITADDEYLRRGRERGRDLVMPDAESEEFAAVTLAELMAKAEAKARRRRRIGPPELIKMIRAIFQEVGDPAGLTQEHLAEKLAAVDPDRWALENFDGDDEEQAAARTEAVRAAVTAVLAPDNLTWPLEKWTKAGPRGWRLRDLKVITGEAPKAP
ncbi:DNA translocase FtsK [Streptomyces sp. NPDC091204]|uniref:DNA translocase FtsK n=1 Tax=Streptomyces sp. NPDC091204 TaxID=3155299 RepID=UPI003423E125